MASTTELGEVLALQPGLSVLDTDRSHTAPMVALVLGAVAVVGLGTGVLIGVAGGGSDGPPPVAAESGTPTATPSPTASRGPSASTQQRPTTRADSDVERGRTSDVGYFLGASQRADGMHVQFDRAVLYVGSEARSYAEANGLEDRLRDGKLLVNENPRTRDMVLAPDVQVIGAQELAGAGRPTPVTVPALLDAIATRGPQLLLDLTYDRLGYVVKVEEKNF